MPIVTQPATTITSSELARANQALVDLDAARVDVARLTTEKTSLSAEVLRLNGVIAALQTQIPVPVPPPVVVPPVTPARSGLYVDGPVLRSKTGAEVILRGIELMYGADSSRDPVKSVAACKSFGANSVGPLYEFEDMVKIRAHLVACRAANVLVGFNVDHTSSGRAFLLRADVVALCNEYRERVFLQCEVELGNETQTPDQWSVTAKAFVKALRDAGHVCPIKVGSPFSGRDPRHAIAKGSEVLASDPLKSCIFTWQAYWGVNPSSGWTYPGEFGFPTPSALDPIRGHKAAADAIKASGLCFVVGLDAVDDIGDTGYVALANYLHSLKIGWQFWALVNDGRGSNVSTEALGTTPTTPHGAAVKALLTAQSVANSL